MNNLKVGDKLVGLSEKSSGLAVRVPKHAAKKLIKSNPKEFNFASKAQTKRFKKDVLKAEKRFGRTLSKPVLYKRKKD